MMQVFPSAGAQTTIVVRGRTYTRPVGSTITVPDHDAFVLCSNGWLRSALDGAGTTAQRPSANPTLGISPPRVGFHFYDTTIGATVIWNGATWVHYATGASS
jgi:hypothetical protein